MAYGLLTVVSIPTVTGVAKGISVEKYQKKESEDELLRKFRSECYCKGKGSARATVHGGTVVLIVDKA